MLFLADRGCLDWMFYGGALISFPPLAEYRGLQPVWDEVMGRVTALTAVREATEWLLRGWNSLSGPCFSRGVVIGVIWYEQKSRWWKRDGNRHEFQYRAAAWVAVKILAEKDVSPPWDLPADTTLDWLRCETGQLVDDMMVGTSADGFMFCQIKHMLVLSQNAHSDLAFITKSLEDLLFYGT